LTEPDFDDDIMNINLFLHPCYLRMLSILMGISC